MTRYSLNTLLIFFILSTVALSGCKEEEEPIPQNIELTFNFNHFVGTTPVEFNEIKYVNAYGNPYSVSTLKYFISDIKLTNADGTGATVLNYEHYVDATDAQTLSFSTGAIFLPDTYSSISFIFGLNEEKNISGRFPNPPQSNMEWPEPMGGGYHYMKLEGKVDSAGIINNYQAHSGATMGTPYYFEVILPNSSFNSAEKRTINIGMDINQWWANPNTIDLNTMTSVMGNKVVQQQLKDNGSDVFFLISVE